MQATDIFKYIDEKLFSSLNISYNDVLMRIYFISCFKSCSQSLREYFEAIPAKGNTTLYQQMVLYLQKTSATIYRVGYIHVSATVQRVFEFRCFQIAHESR